MRAAERGGLLRMALWAALAGGCAEATVAVPPPTPVPTVPDQMGDLWGMVPAEADLVLFADLAKLRESAWTRASFAKALGEGGDRLAEMRGMDRVIFAKLPLLREDASVLVGQGRVDRQAIRSGFERGGPVRFSTYRGAELLERGDEALAFVASQAVLSGFDLAVRAAIDCNVGSAPGVEAESWLRHLRGELGRGRPAPPVAALYVRLQPATREELMREMGEGGTLEAVGARIDLAADLDAHAIGVVRSELEARDLAGRLGERMRDARARPIVAAFGLTRVMESLRFAPQESEVRASLHVSQEDRQEIAERMALVADMLAKMKRPQDPRPSR